MALLGMWDEKSWMPVFRGPRYRRYQSIDKMLDLMEVVSRSTPPVPIDVVQLNPYDDEWDDQMTYVKINYAWIWEHVLVYMGMPLWMYIYNHNYIHYNIHYRALKWFFPAIVVWQFEWCYKYYRTQLTKAILFEEYVQARADELIAQREHLLYSDEMKTVFKYCTDLHETLDLVKREAVNNHPSDFKQSEIILQAFINRWVDPAVGLKSPNTGPRFIGSRNP